MQISTNPNGHPNQAEWISAIDKPAWPYHCIPPDYQLKRERAECHRNAESCGIANINVIIIADAKGLL